MISSPHAVVLVRKIGLIVLVVNLILCSQVSAQEDTEAFRQHFEHVRTVQLSDEKALIGRVTSLDVSPTGDFMIADSRSRAVWIFGPDGQLKRQLAPENCHPGFKLRPIAAYYAANKYILLTNSGPWGYRFTMEGTCTGGMVGSFHPTREMTFDEHGHMFGFFHHRSDGEDILKMDSTGAQLQVFDIETTEFTNTISRVSEGGLAYTGGHVYLSKVTGPEIYKYSTDGTRISVFGSAPEYYRPLEEDFPPRGTFNPSSPGMGELMSSFTMPVNLFALDENLLLLCLSDAEAKSGLQMYDTDGNLLAEAHGFETWIMHAEQGRAYVVTQPEAREDGTVPNPSIDVYRYIGPQSR